MQLNVPIVPASPALRLADLSDCAADKSLMHATAQTISCWQGLNIGMLHAREWSKQRPGYAQVMI